MVERCQGGGGGDGKGLLVARTMIVVSHDTEFVHALIDCVLLLPMMSYYFEEPDVIVDIATLMMHES